MKILKEHHIFSFDEKNTPAARVTTPTSITFEILDCFCEQISSRDDTIETINFDRVNPATGPVWFDNIKAGDTLAIHIEDIRIKSPGKITAAPNFGILGEYIKKPETMITPVNDNCFLFKDILFPLNPMVGVIGVAPKGDPVKCDTPGLHGGNMDTKLIAPGSTLYLPIQVDGALLAMGDVHAAMGDGEIIVTGVEVSAEVDVTVEKIEGLTISYPLIKTEKELAFIVSDKTMDGALKQATIEMAGFLNENTYLSFTEVGMLMSVCGNTQISQLVNPLVTGRFSMPTSILKKIGLELDTKK